MTLNLISGVVYATLANWLLKCQKRPQLTVPKQEHTALNTGRNEWKTSFDFISVITFT